jgi:hypothetical protein
MNELVFYGVAGGIVVDLLYLLELRNVPEEQRPPIGDWLYWLPYVVWPILGGFLAHLFLTECCPAPVAFQIGLSAPLILRAMASTIPPLGLPQDESSKTAGKSNKTSDKSSETANEPGADI